MDKREFEILSIHNRIDLLKSREKDNKRIVAKLQRRLRKLGAN